MNDCCTSRLRGLVAFCFACALAASTVFAEEPAKWQLSADAPPREAIRAAVEAGWRARGVTPVERCDDATYLRRACLDLAGRLPTSGERAEFLANDDPDKRVRLVDRLLDSGDHARHLADVFDTLLMGRGSPRAYDERQRHGWRGYLERCFAENRPWNEVARELVLARPTGSADAGSVWFLYERNNKHQAIAEAVAPALFGVRVECAQCHDHPIATEIEQAHYWGLVAFFRRSENRQTKNGPRVAEKAVGGFEQFADLLGESHPNLLAFLDAPVVEESRPADGEKQEDTDALYLSAADPANPLVPKFSRREAFADQVVRGHPRLARAMVNRLWALLLGRGLVHPHDEMDSNHPASHPRLLDWLARDYEQSGYDTRRLIRELVLSEPYQLASRRPSPDADPASFSWSLEKPLIAETWARCVTQLIHGEARQDPQLLRAMREHFPDVLAAEAGTSIGQAMFLSNNEAWNAFFQPAQEESPSLETLAGLPSDEDRVGRLFLAAFGRSPGEDERTRAVAFLKTRADRPQAAFRDLVWAVVTSAEFRLNH